MQDFGTIPYIAGAAVNPFRFLKGGAADNTLIQAAAAADVILGVSKGGAVASGRFGDMQILGVAKVEAGAAVTRFSRVTADSVGRAVAAAPAAGANNGIGGIAMQAATAAGDLIDVLLLGHTLQG